MRDGKDRPICPFFQRKDQRCAERFNLTRLYQVFDQCLGDFNACSIHTQLAIEHDADGVQHHATATAS